MYFFSLYKNSINKTEIRPVKETLGYSHFSIPFHIHLKHVGSFLGLTIDD